MEQRTMLLQGYRIIILLSITACVGGSCDLNAVTSCAAGVDFTDLANLCPAITKLKQCLAPFRENCEGNRAYTAMVTPLANAGSVCGSTDSSSSACNLPGASSCVTGVDFSDVSKLCLSIPKIKQCIAPFKTNCEGNAAFRSLASPLKQAESFCGGTSSSTCDVSALSACGTGVDFSDISNICPTISVLKQCIAPFKTSCEGNSAYLALVQGLHRSASLCGSNGCSLMELTNCTNLVKGGIGFNSFPTAERLTQVCKMGNSLLSCLKPFKESCSKVKNENIQTAMQGIQNQTAIITAFCSNDILDGFKKHMNCFQTSSVQYSVESCLPNFQSANNDDDGQSRIPFDQICSRWPGVETCVNKAVTSTCGSSATNFIVNFIKIYAKTMLQRLSDEKLSCLSNADAAQINSPSPNDADAAQINSPNGAERTLPRLAWIRIGTSLPFILTLYIHIGMY